MILQILTTTHCSTQDESLSDADPETAARTAQVVAAACRLVARAQAVPERVEKQSYGELWKTWAKGTASYPEM